MVIYNLYSYSSNIIELFNKRVYEQFVLELMNASERVFPSTYTFVDDQSNGQCDFVDAKSGEKFDAKLPVIHSQVELLTSGKKHSPQITTWLQEMRDEIAEFNPLEARNSPEKSVSNTKLYVIMKEAILRDKEDESIIFFLPFPITFCVQDSIFLQFTSDYLTSIDEELRKGLNFNNRKIYAIYPSSEKNTFVLRKLGSYDKEYIRHDKLAQYFTYEIIDINFEG